MRGDFSGGIISSKRKFAGQKRNNYIETYTKYYL